MSSSNRTQLARVRQVDRLVIPANPAWRVMRSNNNPFSGELAYTKSAALRADRRNAGYRPTSLTVAAQGLQFELAPGLHDEEIEEAVQSTWAGPPTIVNVTADTEINDVSATTITVASGGAAFLTGLLARMTGFATPANNRLARIASSTATTIVFPAATFTAEAVVPVGARVRVVGVEGAAGDIVATLSGGAALTSTALNFTTLGLAPGRWVRIGGATAPVRFATAGANGFARVSAVAAQRLSFDIAPEGFAADTGAGQTIQVFFGDWISEGTTMRPVAFETAQMDHAPVSYERYLGCYLANLVLNVPSEESGGPLLTGTMDYVGMRYATATSLLAGATYTQPPEPAAAPSYSVAANILFKRVTGVTLGPDDVVTAMTQSIANALRRRGEVGVLGSGSIGNGSIEITGDLRVYFGSLALRSAALTGARIGLHWGVGLTEGSGMGYVFDVPAAVVTGDAPAAGIDTDRIFEGRYMAEPHATLGIMCSVTRFHHLPV